MELLTSDSMLLPIIAATGLTYFFLKVRPVPYFWWLQLQRRGGLTGVCVAAVSQPGEQWMKRPPFSSIRIESHRNEVFVEPWIAVVEKVRKMITKSGKSWGIYSKLQVTREWMTVNLHIVHKIHPAAYRYKLVVIPTVPQLAVIRSDHVWLFVCVQGYIQVNNSWYHVFDRYKKEILRRKGRLVMFVSTASRDLTWNRRWLSCHNVRLVLLFHLKWRSKRRFWFLRVDQTYEPWHKKLGLRPRGPYLATSNITPNNKVNQRYNGQCS
jgi:hypothetical protein